MRLNTKINKLLAMIPLMIALNARAEDVGFDCTLTIGAVNFGKYNPFDYAVQKVSSSLTVKCTTRNRNQPVYYALGLSPGNSDDFSNRKMTAANLNPVLYNIYADSAYSQILGYGKYSQTFGYPANSTVIIKNNYTLNSVGSSRTNSFPIYASMPVQPLAQAGFYRDFPVVILYYSAYDEF